VQILQRAFVDLGFTMPRSAPQATRLPDGVFGEEISRTVKKFQAQQGLVQDGIVVRQTLERLDKIFVAASAQAEVSLRLQTRRAFWT
jgi:peptidoglycan hydrolase-like protein with peptidoglycan-binding domain